MFNLFSKNKNPQCPIDNDQRLWMENAFLWIATQFGQDNIRNKPMLYPNPECFPIKYDGSVDSLLQTAEIVARQMEIDFSEINLATFKQNIQEFQGEFGHRLFTEVDKEASEKLAAGLYFDKNESGKYDIFIEEKSLRDPEGLVAVLAHEFAHIKILGEKRLGQNDEFLTDLLTVAFGLGIFNANSSFKDFKTFDSFGHNSLGYLKQQEWGYALALYAHFREEDSPAWVRYLGSNIRSDFMKAQAYILANKEKVFWEDSPDTSGGG
jgi:hypothetical protein